MDAAASCSAMVGAAFGADFAPFKEALIGPLPPGGGPGGFATLFSPCFGVGYLIGTGGRGMNCGAFCGAGACCFVGAYWGLGCTFGCMAGGGY